MSDELDRLNDEERRLQRALGAPPAPRRTDAAFALAVRGDIERSRKRAFFVPLALSGAAVSAALVLALVGSGAPLPSATPSVLFHSTLAALADDEPLFEDDALLAVAETDLSDLVADADEDNANVDDADFDLDDDDELLAWPTMDDDSDDTLLALSDALDDALGTTADSQKL